MRREGIVEMHVRAWVAAAAVLAGFASASAQSPGNLDRERRRMNFRPHRERRLSRESGKIRIQFLTRLTLSPP
jgi:hypothetical protein